ncbi:class I SAM-dependent methyltransferase [Paenibacillus eucommiae]|uniref:Ubiquinone/menaquinone biosynthesis C-methylase UbiE n=1 Tax=Paenibacillus eucommiae TaxID=1355755 RepID=A0ABS4ISH0_9BACL|nr:class I SAM-dependent methyltransferase [Paenibacillus eucommiae]MBP1990513.1 ubiquinone/menaquinone biosynthesis C-methylase UbiE [Paenibacillus eucommiae]
MDIYLKILFDEELLACVTFFFCRDAGLNKRYTMNQPQTGTMNYLVSEGVLHIHTNQVIDQEFGYICFEYYRQGKCLDIFDTLLLEEAQGREKVLDLCCGAGATVHALATSNPDIIYAIDNNPSSLSFLRNTLASIHDGFSGEVVVKAGDAHEIDLEDHLLDFVVCRAALQYLDVPAVLKEMFRVLNANGKLFLLVHGSGYIFDYIGSRKRFYHKKTMSFLAKGMKRGGSLSKVKFLKISALERKLRKAGFKNVRCIRSAGWDIFGRFPVYFGVVAEK